MATINLDDNLVQHYIEYLDSGEERAALVERIADHNGRPCYYALDRDDEYQAGGSKSGQQGGWYHVYIPPSHLIRHSCGCYCQRFGDMISCLTKGK